ncbi:MULTISPECIES: VOC family protein [Calothrix]|uniref:VOC family protein n=2 Tax=Calothrix TaxID=1186 RepID=A0ABR8AJ74_9CYAN|nr:MULTISPECIES: VOC family protein [Calothrix]MBD2200106.1 VOC family protein [Calothrix parietina FACHB-288]MBD2229079.1 VOC family protein [Calothrix anomala FACHB-343]
MTNVFQQHGAFSWCELMTTNTTAAKEFYSRLFGWTMEDKPIPEGVYTVLSAARQQVGGLMKMPDEMSAIPPHWGVYVTVQNVDTTAKQVEELGGKVCLAPMDIPDVGRFAMIQDPQGATLSIISYGLMA